jgi:prevent-host-death family protein
MGLTLIEAAKYETHLSRYVDQAVAGEEVVIARAGKPLVRLVPVEPQRPQSGAGASSEDRR